MDLDLVWVNDRAVDKADAMTADAYKCSVKSGAIYHLPVICKQAL